MMKRKIFFLTLLVILLTSGIATAEMYKWKDADGVTHYSDQPPQDSKLAEEVKSIPTHSPSPNNSKNNIKNTNARSKANKKTAKKSKRRKKPKVELYTTSWCPYCQKARNFFRSKGISFTEYDIEKDKSAANRKRQLDSRNGVPFAVVNGKKIHGYAESAYEKALENN